VNHSSPSDLTVAVVALGKIGLPVAVHYATRGHRVIGCDLNPAIVAAINRGDCPIDHEPGLPAMLADAVRSGAFVATADTAAAVAEADVVVVLVPLDVDTRHQPRFESMDAAIAAIARGLRPDTLVLLETTVPAGATRGRFLPMLEAAGFRHGRDFSLAFSPERVQSGRVLRDLTTYPRIVGGVDANATERAAAFCKLAESVYRDVNIALANELARAAAAHDVDIHEVIPAANSQPQSNIHRPGLGVGGHCIPVYPYFLSGGATDAPLTLAARAINDGMPAYAADLLDDALGGLAGRRVLLLGLTYRPGVRETAYSPALALAEVLRHAGALVAGHDPLLDAGAVAALGLTAAEPDGSWPADALVLHTSDPAYLGLDLGRMHSLRVVLDGPGMLDPESVAARGIAYVGIGRPGAPVTAGARA
jgi:UDP-N-acetyl-D-mannosaminuronate dehydrogenase